MKARDVMSSPAISVRPQVPAYVAAALLVSHGFTAAPVVDDDGCVVGIATEADLMRLLIAEDGRAADGHRERTVEDVMTPAPVVVRSDDDLADVLATMLDRGTRSVPVLDGDRLAGVLSRRDILRLVARGTLTTEDLWRRRVGAGSG
jgi:CBS domain-containing protein